MMNRGVIASGGGGGGAVFPLLPSLRLRIDAALEPLFDADTVIGTNGVTDLTGNHTCVVTSELPNEMPIRYSNEHFNVPHYRFFAQDPTLANGAIEALGSAYGGPRTMFYLFSFYASTPNEGSPSAECRLFGIVDREVLLWCPFGTSAGLGALSIGGGIIDDTFAENTVLAAVVSIDPATNNVYARALGHEFEAVAGKDVEQNNVRLVAQCQNQALEMHLYECYEFAEFAGAELRQQMADYAVSKGAWI